MNDEVAGTGVAPEEIPSLAEFAEEPGGAWPKGWYKGTIIDGYATQSGKIFSTDEGPSSKGDSRNLFICVALTDGKSTRNIRQTFNYRPEDFTAERLQQIKELREQFRGQRGSWIGQTDVQRSSLSIAKLGQLEKAVGFKLKRTAYGTLRADVFPKTNVDVQLGVDENGFNEITTFAQAGSRVR